MQENQRWHEACSSMHITSVGRVLMSFISLTVSRLHTRMIHSLRPFGVNGSIIIKMSRFAGLIGECKVSKAETKCLTLILRILEVSCSNFCPEIAPNGCSSFVRSFANIYASKNYRPIEKKSMKINWNLDNMNKVMTGHTWRDSKNFIYRFWAEFSRNFDLTFKMSDIQEFVNCLLNNCRFAKSEEMITARLRYELLIANDWPWTVYADTTRFKTGSHYNE